MLGDLGERRAVQFRHRLKLQHRRQSDQPLDNLRPHFFAAGIGVDMHRRVGIPGNLDGGELRMPIRRHLLRNLDGLLLRQAPAAMEIAGRGQ
jgi:hypothetical protein